MSALLVLLAAAALLLALGAAGRIVPGRVAALQAGVCLVGLAAALVAPGVAVLETGAVFAVDGLTGAVLAALFLLGACGAAGPVTIGAVALAMLAGDAVTLVVVTAAVCLTRPGWRVGALALGGLAVALLLLAWHGPVPDPRFAAMRGGPPGAVAGGVALLGVLIAAAALPMAMPAIPGALLSFALLARVLLDLSGPVTPGWWGVPVLLLGAAGAVVMARRAAPAAELAVAVACCVQATAALAVCGIGVVLLARGADLPPLAALAMTGALLLVLTSALWGGLALLACGAIQSTAGTTALARLGGLLRRVPVTGLALLIGLLSVAAVPLSAGFAAYWTLLQALLGAARLGGTGLGGTVVLALVAGVAACLGLAIALLAASGLRLAGASLLGTPRSGRAAAAAEPAMAVRIGMGVLACMLIAAGLVPSLLVPVAQPAIRQLTGGAAEGATMFGLSASADAAGYAALGVAGLLAVCTAAAVWAGRGATVLGPVWRGGLGEDGPGLDGRGRANTMPLLLWPEWRTWCRAWWHAGRPGWPPRVILAGLALALAAALGWAAR